jgi:hypothetical protein
VIWAGCSSLPESFPPPEQRTPTPAAQAGPFGYFLNMSDPNAGAYLVQGFEGSGPGTWRWAYEHPVLRFLVPDVAGLKFTMDFSLPERTFRETGPVTLTFTLNGKLLDRARFEQAGQLHYSHDVPPALLRKNAVNLVAIDPYPVWVSKADGGRLGFILSRAGFTD